MEKYDRQCPFNTMPPLVDAFKSMSFAHPYCMNAAHTSPLDLIRHGKHHNHANVDDPKNQTPDTRGLRQPPSPAKATSTTPPREAAELIVQEERRQKSIMPIYKGLEAYELTDKMGELVPSFCTLRL
jgi:hypothetical protein